MSSVAAKIKGLISSCIPQFSYRHHCCNITKNFQTKTRPVIPDNYPDAVIVFRVFFEEYSYASDRAYAGSPPSYHSIFKFIPGFEGKLRFLRTILKDMCKTGCHCDALFDVFAENMHAFMSREHENALRRNFFSPNNYWKYFFQKSMIMIRVFQHKNFPSVSCGRLVLLCPDFQKQIEQKMEQKSGFESYQRRHHHLKKYLENINQASNQLHSSAIQRLLNENENFFSRWYNDLNTFFHRSYQFSKTITKMQRTLDKPRKIITNTFQITISFDSMYSKKAEENWIPLMTQGCPELLAEFRKHSIGDDTIRWIFYWYFHQMEFPSGISFNDIMRDLVQPGRMSFLFPQPPKIFSDNNGSRRQNGSLLDYPCVPVNYLLEICLIMDSPPAVPPSAKVIAKSFRRICDRRKANYTICKGLFEIIVRPTIRTFLVKFMLNHRNTYAMKMLEREYALKKQNPGLCKYLNRFMQEHLLRLKILPFWSLLIRKIFSRLIR